MPTDRGRAGIALLCLLAVVLAASQFPATGFGASPDGGGPFADPGSEPAAGPGGQSGTAGGPTDATAAPSTSQTATAPATSTGPDDDPSTTAGITDSPAGGTTSQGAETTTQTTTATTTTTATATEAAASAGDDGGDSGLAEVAANVLLVLFGGVTLLVGILTPHRSYRHDIGLGRSFLSLVGVGAAYVGGDGDGGRRLPSLGGLFLNVPQTTMSVVIGSSAAAPQFFDALGGVAGGFATGTRVALGGVGRALGGGLLAVPRGVGSALGGLGGALAGGLLAFPSGAGSVLGGLVGDGDGTVRGTSRPDADVRDASDVEPEEPSEPDPPASVEEAWERMVDAASVYGTDSQTPVETARTVVRRGLPAEPVGTLTKLFRYVRYSPAGGDRSQLERARDALDDIEGGEES